METTATTSKGAIVFRIFGFIGLSISFSLVLMISISSLLEFIFIPIGPAILPVSMLLSLIVSRFAIRLPNISIYIIACLLSLIAFGLCVLLTGQFIDSSFDGNMYQKIAVMAFSNGWNPLLGSLIDTNSYIPSALSSNFDTASLLPEHALWLDHYSQGSWKLSACFYAFFQNIEYSKANTLLLTASSALLLGYYLSLKRKFTNTQIAITIFIAFTNPVVLAQFTTFYVDGFLGASIFVLLIGLIMAVDKDCQEMKLCSYILVSIGVICSTAAKITGLAYSAVFCLSFFALYCFKVLRKKDDFTPRSLRTLLFFAISLVLFTVFAINYSPLVTNFSDHGNPLYPLIGEGSVDIMTGNSPKNFVGNNIVSNLLTSIFSNVSNIYYSLGYDPTLKTPLTVHDSELSVLFAADLRISGFGVLYSGIFLFLLVLIPVALIKSRKRYTFLFQVSLCYLIPMLLLVFFIKESWWARYSPYTYYSVYIAFLFLFMESNQSKEKIIGIVAKICTLILAILVIANSYYWLRYGTLANLRKSISAEKIISELNTASSQGEQVDIAVWGPMYGMTANLDDHNIEYDMSPYDENAEYDGSLFDYIYYDIVPPTTNS